jgi:protein-disulfide isomerase
MHKEAAKAAEASICAQEQGRFWDMHARLFANRRQLQIPDLKRYAGEIGLDQAKFDGCLNSSQGQATWRRDMDDAAKLGVAGTPAFFVNGRSSRARSPWMHSSRSLRKSWR